MIDIKQERVSKKE